MDNWNMCGNRWSPGPLEPWNPLISLDIPWYVTMIHFNLWNFGFSFGDGALNDQAGCHATQKRVLKISLMTGLMNGFAGTKSQPSCDWRSILEYLGVLGPPKRPGSKMWETQPTGWSFMSLTVTFHDTMTPFITLCLFHLFHVTVTWINWSFIKAALNYCCCYMLLFHVISSNFSLYHTLSHPLSLLCFIEALRLLRQRSRGGGAEGSLNSAHSGPRVAGRYRVSKGEWNVVDFWLGQHGNSRSLLGQPVSKEHQVMSQIYIKSQSPDQSLSI